MKKPNFNDIMDMLRKGMSETMQETFLEEELDFANMQHERPLDPTIMGELKKSAIEVFRGKTK